MSPARSTPARLPVSRLASTWISPVSPRTVSLPPAITMAVFSSMPKPCLPPVASSAATSRPNRPRCRKCWSTSPTGKKPSPRPMLSLVSCGSAAGGWTSASTELPLVIMGSLMMAAPALLPDTSPPAAQAARIASSAGVGLPSWISAWTIRAWSPPVK